MISVSLATPGTEACDAVGGALRPEWREWQGNEFGVQCRGFPRVKTLSAV
jgi:hypothetical protein